MIAIFKDGKFKTENIVPEVWNKVQNYRNADPSVWYADGWRVPIYPPINPITQKLGELKWVDEVGGDVTFQVIDLPDEELKSKMIQNEQFEKEKLIKEKLEKQVEDQIQSLTDNGEILANKKGFPIWETFADGHEFPLNFKVKDFVGPELELVIFRCNTLHIKDATNKPETSSLWDSITMAEWVPGQVYMQGDQVTFNGKIYESQINNNTNSPGNSSKDIWLEIKV